MMRIEFFNKVFNFDSPNLSYFPAQAGEMELLADKCINKIEPQVEELTNRAGGPVSIPSDFVFDLYNNYLEDKNVQLVKSEEQVEKKGTGKVYIEFIKQGYGPREFIEQKLKKFLIDKIFPKGIPSLVDFFVDQQDKEKREKLLKDVYNIFNNNNYEEIMGPDLKKIQISMFDKIYKKIITLSETEFPVNIKREKLESELSSAPGDFPAVIDLQNRDRDGAWEDLGKIIDSKSISASKQPSPSEQTPPFMPDINNFGILKDAPDFNKLPISSGGELSTTGLSNCENKCYLNSTLQMLYNIPEFSKFILAVNLENVESKFSGPTYNEPTTTMTKEGMNKPKTLTGEALQEYKSKIITGVSALKYIFTLINKKQTTLTCTDNKYYDAAIKYLVNIIKNNYDTKLGYAYDKTQYDKEYKGYTETDSPFQIYTRIVEPILNNFQNNDLTIESNRQWSCTTKKLEGGKSYKEYLLKIPFKNETNKIFSTLQDAINSLNKTTSTNKDECRINENNKNSNNANITESIIVPEDNKYITIILNRVIGDPENATFIPGNITVDKNITIDGKSYTLYGCILYTSPPAHYTYAQYTNGNFTKYYNDSILDNPLPPTVTPNSNGYIFTYKRDSSIAEVAPSMPPVKGGTKNKTQNNLRIKQLQYGRRTRRKLKN
jgi:hypothetical protein